MTSQSSTNRPGPRPAPVLVVVPLPRSSVVGPYHYPVLPPLEDDSRLNHAPVGQSCDLAHGQEMPIRIHEPDPTSIRESSGVTGRKRVVGQREPCPQATT